MKKNILRDVNPALIESVIETKDLRIERVVSHGQVSSPASYCEPIANQFVLLLEGQARLEVEKEKVGSMPRGGRLLENKKVNLIPGDYISIPQHTRHRVDWTSPDEETVWLSVYFGGNIGEGKYQRN